ncbi:MAG TPA: MBL fold metallo-hydrolase [Vicinamibacterales bacterium]|nr:MBL fold metallo-hydrolase [Vicinamibacterales bacterium]
MQAYGVRGSSDEFTTIECARGVERVATGFVNCYLVGTAGNWVLVDTGLPGCSALVHRAADALFGPDAVPKAIVLTHGHFDHAGNTNAIAADLNIPVYAHDLERPYLDGRSDYPPGDPTIGGAIAQMSRAFPSSGRTVPTLKGLDGDRIPDMEGWRWIHTPGHTAGHISLFRESDGVLIAGDALTTMDLDSWTEQVKRTPQFCVPPSPMTTDWEAARQSVLTLAALKPRVVAAGHGVPIAGAGVTDAMHRFAGRFTPPPHGRYVTTPAVAGPAGVEWVPPPVPDPLPKRAAGVAMVVVGAIGLAAAMRGRRRS